MSFLEYKEKIKGDYRPAVKIEWLNPDETVKFEFTNSLYDVEANVDVNKQSGCRRTCTVKLNNDSNRFPINYDNIWLGQKFKLWMGIYLDDETPYYLPQGVFYVSNPRSTYDPNTRTVTINGVDKWAYLDGSLHGVLTGAYQTNVGTNLYDATRELLRLSSGRGFSELINSSNIQRYFNVINGKDYYHRSYFEGNGSVFTANNETGIAQTTLVAKQTMEVSFKYYYHPYNSHDNFKLMVGNKTIENSTSSDTIESSYKGFIYEGESIVFEYNRYYETGYSSYHRCYFFDMAIDIFEPVDPIPPLLSPYFLTKTIEVDGEEKSVLSCPYTATVERGQSYADVLLEYATILCANVYYDVDGRFVLEPMIDTADDVTDTNKEILWDYSVDEKTFLGITQAYNFDKIYNDFIVLGNIVNGYQFKGRVQNRNLLSDTCVQKIGLKTKPPYEDNQYVSDEQCVELATYYAKIDTIMQKSGDIPSVTLYHLDVDKLVTVSTPNNNMSKELFLITGFSLSTSNTMTVNVTSVNILNDFSVVEVD